jgi:hypothetical protein
MLVQFSREEPGDNVEIFVVVRGEPARVRLRGFRRAAGCGDVGGEFEFNGTQHDRTKKFASSQSWRKQQVPWAPNALGMMLCSQDAKFMGGRRV